MLSLCSMTTCRIEYYREISPFSNKLQSHNKPPAVAHNRDNLAHKAQPRLLKVHHKMKQPKLPLKQLQQKPLHRAAANQDQPHRQAQLYPLLLFPEVLNIPHLSTFSKTARYPAYFPISTLSKYHFSCQISSKHRLNKKGHSFITE